MTQESIQSYWQEFLSTLPSDSPYHSKAYVAEGWGDGPDMADELGALIAQGVKTGTCSALWEWEAEGNPIPQGVKTGTCSALWEWEAEGNPIPQVGMLTVVLDGRREPLCIVETVEVTIRKYNEVDANFARSEGEGDLSLAYWREAHKNFFSRTLSKIGREFSEDMPLVCERFRMIYK